MRVAHRGSANKAQISPQEVCTEKRWAKKEGKQRQRKNMKGGRRKETNPESGARRNIFGDGLCSMGLARVGCQMRCIEVCTAGKDLVNDEGTFPLGLKFVLCLVRQA